MLLVDADLEAPGITWMFTAHGRRVDFAYEDFLSLLHSSEDGRPDDAVTLGSAYLPNRTIDNVIVMPTRRTPQDIAPPRIQPTDPLTPERSIYYLTESLGQLAHRLDARAVLIDLRAGGSELSAPVLLDPRVQRIFVTTISDQALIGTVRTIQELGRRAPSRPEDPASAAVITRFHPQGHGELAVRAAAMLRDVISKTLEPGGQESDDRVVDGDVTLEPILSVFQDGLLALPSSWEAVVDLVRRQRLDHTLAPLADELSRSEEPAFLPQAGPPVSPFGPDEHLAALRGRLGDFARRLAYAETADDTAFLPTESLRNLLTSHRTEPPLCVVAGAKGSGRTFTQIQMCFRRTWRDYAADVGVPGVSLQALLAPVFISKNLKDDAYQRIRAIQCDACVSSAAEPASQLELRDLIDRALRSQLSDSEWRRVWLTCMARAVGIDAEPADVERKLADFAHGDSRIFVVRGGVQGDGQGSEQAAHTCLGGEDGVATLPGGQVGRLVPRCALGFQRADSGA